jgi:hypothetical protein
MSNSSNAWIGITAALVSAALSSLGVNLQALGLSKLRDENLETITDLPKSTTSEALPTSIDESNLLQPELTNNEVNAPLLVHIPENTNLENSKTTSGKSWHWYVGFFLYIFCELFGSVFALAFISPVLLAPLGSAGPIFNIIFSKVFLGTPITLYNGIGTGLIVSGGIVVSIFGSHLPDGGKNSRYFNE